jgi:hypothetical protein
MLTVNQLRQVGKHSVELHNYYIQNYKMNQDIIVQYNDSYFLVGDDIFVNTLYNLYDLFNLFALDISLMHCFTL